MNYFKRSITAICTCALLLLLGFYSGLAQYAPIKPTSALNPEISTRTVGGILHEIPRTYVEDTDGTLYVAGSYDYSNFLAKYDPASPENFSWLIKLTGNSGSGYDGIKHIFVSPDNSLNVIVANILSTTDLDPGPGITTISNDKDLIWIKYRKDGSFVFVRKLTEAIGNPYYYVSHATTDAEGNLYIYGMTYSFDQSTGGKNLALINGGSFVVSETEFLAKYDLSGVLVWAKTFPRNLSRYIQDMAVAHDGVYLSGYFSNAVDFDPDAGVQIMTAPSGYRDAFLAKYDGASGAYAWAFSIGGTGADGIEKILIKNDAVMVCGVYTYTGNEGVDFDPSPQSTYLLKGTVNKGQLFTATYSLNKEFRSAMRLTEGVDGYASNFFSVNSFTTDAQGQYYIGGSKTYSGEPAWDVDPSANQYLLHLTAGLKSTGYILKYSNNGALAWGSAYYQSGGWYDQIGHFFPSRAAGTPYMVIGTYQGSTTLDPVTGGTLLVSNRYDPNNQEHYQELFIAPYCELTAIPTPASAWPGYMKAGTSARLKIKPVAGATGYEWTLPSGFSITGGNNTTEVVVTASASATSGTVAVKAINACGASAAYSLAVTVGTKDAATVTQGNIFKMYGDPPVFTLQATSNSTGVITYQVISNPANAISLTGNTVTITGLGEAVLAAKVTGDSNYGDGVQEFIIGVNKRLLTVKAESYVRLVGKENPPFNVSYTGFVAGDDTSHLDVAPVATTYATASSPVGVYPITVSGGNDDHYAFLYESGTLSVVSKLPATITFSNLTQSYNGSFIQPTVTTEPDGLSVKLLYNGSTLPPKDAGTYAVEAIIQSTMYEGSVTATFVVEKAAQVITLGSFPDLVAGQGAVSMLVQASSGLPVTLAAAPSGLVSIQGTSVTPLSAGLVQLTFSQPGDHNYHAASRQVSVCIKPHKPVVEIVSLSPEYGELKSSSKLRNQWYRNNILVPDEVAQIYFVTQSGVYHVKVTVNSCENISDPVSISLSSTEESFSVSSYPNPAIETVTVSILSPEPDASVAIFNDKGVKVSEVQAKERTELRVDHLPPGIYHLVIWDGHKKKTQRLLKK